jgi:RND family efflux transporter MFP subunit
LTVTVAMPQMASMAQKISANGSLAAWQEAIVGAEANGLKITEVRVNVGDRVQRGDVLATLQADTLRAELAQAQAALAEATASAQEAQAQAERARSLQQQGFFSNAQLSQALAAQASAAARVQSARAMVQLQGVRLSQTQVRAPDAGTISARQATVGSVVGAGTELFRLIRQGRIEWRAEVTAAEVGRIQVGAPVQVRAASGQVLQGKVRMVAPSVDVQTRNALVYVDLPSATGSARAGMYAQGDIGLGQSQALSVPQAAVVVRDGFSYVYTVGADQKVSQIKVQTGRQSGDRVEVLSGLKAEAQVVASGGAFLNQGDTVRVVDAALPAAASK